MDSQIARTATELRRGCAEKKIRSLRKMLAQIVANSSIMPAWAIMAVPEGELEDCGGENTFPLQAYQ